MPIGISMPGLADLERKFEKAGRDLRPELEQTTDRAVKYVHSSVPGYPPPPAGSTYERTGTLGRSLTTEVRALGGDVVGAIGTNVVYSPWVISDEPAMGAGPQAWMHVGRWWTLQGVVEKARDAVVGIYREMVQRLLKLEI